MAIPSLKLVASYLRASGVRLWQFYQDVAQLQTLYPTDWQVLANNASALTFLPGNPMAAVALAPLAGVATSELSRLESDQQLVCEVGKSPRIVRQMRYWKDQAFIGRFDAPGRYPGGPRAR